MGRGLKGMCTAVAAITALVAGLVGAASQGASRVGRPPALAAADGTSSRTVSPSASPAKAVSVARPHLSPPLRTISPGPPGWHGNKAPEDFSGRRDEEDGLPF